MHTVSMKKKFSMSFTVEAPKGRGFAIPIGSRFKDKRRKPKVQERASFRKELNRG